MITSMKYHFVTELGRDTFLAHAKLHLDLESYTTHLPGAATGEPLRAISVYFRANLFAKSRRCAATDESASSVSAPHLMNMVTRPLPTCVLFAAIHSGMTDAFRHDSAPSRAHIFT